MFELYLERPSIDNVEYVRNYTMRASFILEKNVSAGFRLGKTMTEGKCGDSNPSKSLSILISVKQRSSRLILRNDIGGRTLELLQSK